MPSIFEPYPPLPPGLVPSPVQGAAPPAPRKLVLVGALLGAGLVLGVLSNLRLGGELGVPSTIPSGGMRTVAISLFEASPAFSPALPIPSSASGLVPGIGHRAGTGGLPQPVVDRAQAPVGGVEGNPEPAPAVGLPLAAPGIPTGGGSGNGLAAGDGQDGVLGGSPAPGARVPDFRLVLVHAEVFNHRLGVGEAGPKAAVRVRLSIGADGIPVRAQAVEGPPLLYREAEAVALKYRFEPLAPHGLRAPYVTHILFAPRMVR